MWKRMGKVKGGRGKRMSAYLARPVEVKGREGALGFMV